MMATCVGNGLQSALVGRLWNYVNSELSRKVVVENCLRQRAILASSQRENNLLERHRWQFLTSDHRFQRVHESPVSREITNMCGNKHQKEKESIHLQ